MCDKWVSAKDRAPEKYGRYMVHTIDGGITDGVFYANPEPQGIFRVDGEYPEVTHWMPMPEPPSEKESCCTCGNRECGYELSHPFNVTVNINAEITDNNLLEQAVEQIVRKGLQGY